MTEIKSIAVYAASSSQVPQPFFEAAGALGAQMAAKGIRLVYGAGKVGLMGALADACLGGGGTVTGVIPQFMVDNGWQYDRLSEIIVTGDMHNRKSLMAERSDAIVAMPGGCGTMEELLEIITWRQLGLFKGLIIIFNVDGYYDNLLKMLSHSVEEGFMKASHANLWLTASTAQEVINLLRNADSSISIESKY